MEQRTDNPIAVQLSIETFQVLTNYLGTRPYREVAGIMNMMQVNRAIYAEPGTTDEIPKSAGTQIADTQRGSSHESISTEGSAGQEGRFSEVHGKLKGRQQQRAKRQA